MATTDTLNFDDKCKSEKVVYKRRSSIFQTKIIPCDQNEDDNEVNGYRFTPGKEKKEYNEQNTKDFNLKEYIEKLRQERKDWQQEYRNRKTQRKNLTKEKISLIGQGQVLDVNILTEPERDFLLTRPNYEFIYKNSQKLLDVTLKMSILSELVHKLNLRFMEKMKNNISKATKNVIKMSEE